MFASSDSVKMKSSKDPSSSSSKKKSPDAGTDEDHSVKIIRTPTSLRTLDLNKLDDSLFWVPHAEFVFVPARAVTAEERAKFTTQKNKTAYFSLPDEDVVQVDDVPPKIDPAQLKGLPDILKTAPPYRGGLDAAMLETVRRRFLEGQIYTAVDKVLLAVNPFQPMKSLYGAKEIARLAKRADAWEKPHVYSVARSARQAMEASGKDQTILVTGESGSGKTETTKQLLAYIAHFQKSSKDDKKKSDAADEDTATPLEEKLLATSAVLEAFGHASTSRNPNSSRFGKHIEMDFDRDGQLEGCQIKKYFVELNRVVKPGEGERNFHVFYQLLANKVVSVPKAQCVALNNIFEAPGVDDEQCFHDMMFALGQIGISETTELLKMASSVLLLGMMEFEDDRRRIFIGVRNHV